MTMIVPAADFAAGTKAGGFDARWRRHAVVLLGAALLIVALFHDDAATLANIWCTSTTFGHCLFNSPVIACLVRQRRAELAQVTPAGWWPGMQLGAAGGFGGLLGDAASVALARHLGLVMMLLVAVV